MWRNARTDLSGPVQRKYSRFGSSSGSQSGCAVRSGSSCSGAVSGHGRVELTKFHTPPAVRAEPESAPANALGIRRIMFAVDDIDDVVARLRSHGAELVGEIAQYEDIYRLCFLRGPEGIIIGLAEQLS